MWPHPEPPPTFLSTLSLGCPRALTLGAVLHASNSHLSTILLTVMYMFQCYSPKSSHPLLPLSPKVHYVCVSFAARMQDHWYNLSKFHVYVLVYSICLALSDLHHSVKQALGSSTALALTQQLSLLYLSHSLHIYTITSLSSHLLMDIQVAFMTYLAIVNSATMNTGVHVSLSILVFSG